MDERADQTKKMDEWTNERTDKWMDRDGQTNGRADKSFVTNEWIDKWIYTEFYTIVLNTWEKLHSRQLNEVSSKVADSQRSPVTGLTQAFISPGYSIAIRADEHKSCNWGMQLIDGCSFKLSFSGIIWHIPVMCEFESEVVF